MSDDFLFWFTVVSAVINVLLLMLSYGLYVADRKEKERRNAQVKIWMQTSNGLAQALERVISDKWNNFYSTVQDVTNAIHAIHASAFALYQSLYEERAMTEEEYKKEQRALRESINKTAADQHKLLLPNDEPVGDNNSGETSEDG